MLNKNKTTLIIVILLASSTLSYFLIKIITSSPIQKTEESSNIGKENSNENFCENLYQEVKDDIANANYCENDGDCTTLVLGGQYIAFGCYHFINKSVDQENIYVKAQTYHLDCLDLINECDTAPESKCVSNLCVSAE